jgi:hypothetical protein
VHRVVITSLPDAVEPIRHLPAEFTDVRKASDLSSVPWANRFDDRFRD